MKGKILQLAILFQIFFVANVQAQSTWQTQSAPVSADLISVCFTDTSHGWIA